MLCNILLPDEDVRGKDERDDEDGDETSTERIVLLGMVARDHER